MADYSSDSLSPRFLFSLLLLASLMPLALGSTGYAEQYSTYTSVYYTTNSVTTKTTIHSESYFTSATAALFPPCTTNPCELGYVVRALYPGSVIHFKIDLMDFSQAKPNDQYTFFIIAGTHGRVWQKTTNTGSVEDTLLVDQSFGGSRLDFWVTAPNPKTIFSAEFEVELGTGTVQVVETTMYNPLLATAYYTYTSSFSTRTQETANSFPTFALNQTNLLMVAIVVILVIVVLALIGISLRIKQGTHGLTRAARNRSHGRKRADGLYCVNCGAELPARSKFCNKCGEPTIP